MTQNNQQSGKKRIVLLGHSPLPYENLSKNYAPGARTWHFAKVALEVGSEVLLIASRIPHVYDKNKKLIEFEKKGNLNYYSVDGSVFQDKNWLKEKISEFNADCIVGVTTYPASIVADLDLGIPFWSDLYGSVMAEAQVKAFVYDDNSYLNHFFKMEKKVLDKADIFSVVSEAQGFSVIGELGIWGRLSKDTMGYRFVRFIPATAEPKEFKHTKNVIRGTLAKKSDFVILYTGGYNTWTDVNTLFEGLEKAMEKNQQIVFVSTGGQLKGHDDVTYENFKNKISNSKYKNRFHLCGWVPKEDLPNYYLEADLGINSDKFCYEALLGSRTRVLEWAGASLTFISTTLSELTNYLIENDLAFGFQQGNSEDLAEKLVKISQDGKDLDQKKRKLTKILKEEFTFESTSKELLNWLKNPQHSPDFGKTKLLVNQKNSETNSIHQPTSPFSQRFAISLWPKIEKSINLLGLSKYKETLKNTGIKIVFKTPQPIETDKAENYRAKFIEVNLPEMEYDKRYAIPILIKNVGKTIWETPKNPSNTVNFSYRWNDEDGNLVLKNDDRTSLSRNVKPGKTIQSQVVVKTPIKYGKYVLQLDLVKEKHFWFSEIGSENFEARVDVKKKIENNLIKSLPKVSIIVVAYNSENYISKCIYSILLSDYPQKEVIVVDNGSKDNTIGKLKEFGNKIKIIQSKTNLGFASGNNLGIQNSTGDIIILINPDAFVTIDAIRELTLPFLKDDKIMITGSKLLYPNTETIQSAGGIIHKNGLTNHIGNGEEDHNQYDFERLVDYVTGAAMAVRKIFFEESGLFNPSYNPAYFEEMDKCYQARKLNYKVMFEPKSVVYHHESTTHGALSKSFLKLYHKNRFKYIYLNFGLHSFFTDFVPAELKWFFVHCPPEDRSLVILANLRALFSTDVILKKKEPQLT